MHLIYNARKHELYLPVAQINLVKTGGKILRLLSEIGYWNDLVMVIIISFNEYGIKRDIILIVTPFQEY